MFDELGPLFFSCLGMLHKKKSELGTFFCLIETTIWILSVFLLHFCLLEKWNISVTYECKRLKLLFNLSHWFVTLCFSGEELSDFPKFGYLCCQYSHHRRRSRLVQAWSLNVICPCKLWENMMKLKTVGLIWCWWYENKILMVCLFFFLVFRFPLFQVGINLCWRIWYTYWSWPACAVPESIVTVEYVLPFWLFVCFENVRFFMFAH